MRESETVAYGDAVFDLVSHIASADILKIGRDGALAFQVAWLARRIVTINYPNNGVVGIKAGKRGALRPSIARLSPATVIGFRLRLRFRFGHVALLK